MGKDNFAQDHTGGLRDRIILIALAGIPTSILVGDFVGWWIGRSNALFVTADSYGYLAPSISALLGNGFGHTYARPFVYPLFVFGHVAVFNNLSSLVWTQFILYLASIMLLLSLLYLNTSPANRLLAYIRIVLILIGSFAFTYMLLSYLPTVAYIYWLGPELLYMLLAAISVAGVVFAYIAASEGRRTFIALMCTSSLLFWANAFVKPQWFVAAMFLSLVWLLILFTSNATRTTKMKLALGMPAVIAITLFVPEKLLIEKYDARIGGLFGPKTLFCNHSDIVVRASDARPDIWADYSSDFSQSTLQRLREYTNISGGWPLLGFNGDNCMYNGELAKNIAAYFRENTDDERKFYVSVFAKSIIARPDLYVAKAYKQMMNVMQHPMVNNIRSVRWDDKSAREIIERHPSVAHIFPLRLSDAMNAFSADLHPRLFFTSSQTFIYLSQYTWAIVLLGITFHLLVTWLLNGRLMSTESCGPGDHAWYVVGAVLDRRTNTHV